MSLKLNSYYNSVEIKFIKQKMLYFFLLRKFNKIFLFLIINNFAIGFLLNFN